jgi:guanyl-specific ribonuclease Sa
MSISITDNTGRILKELQEAIEIGLEEIGVSAEGYAVAAIESSPRRVDTGLLRNSITHGLSGESPAKGTYYSDDGTKSGSYSGALPGGDKAVYIGTNVEYAGYVHDGTSRMAPNHFLTSAASGHNREYRQIMERALKGE